MTEKNKDEKGKGKIPDFNFIVPMDRPLTINEQIEFERYKREMLTFFTSLIEKDEAVVLTTSDYCYFYADDDELFGMLMHLLDDIPTNIRNRILHYYVTQSN